MAGYLRIKSNKPGATGVVIVNGSASTGYTMLADKTEIPAANLAGIFVDSLDSLGSILASASQGSPELVIGLRIQGSTHATLTTYQSALWTEARDCVTFGGTMRYRPEGATGYIERTIEHAAIPDAWPSDAEAFYRVITTLNLTVTPFSGADGHDVADDFSTDTLGTGGQYNTGGADYTADAGTITNYAVSGGVLDAAANLTTETRYIHTGTGLTLADVECELKHSPGAIAASTKAGVILKRVDASNYLEAYVDDTGAASRVRIDIVIAGARTNLASSAITRLVAGSVYWIKARIEGNVVHAEHWTTEPSPLGTADTTATPATLDSSQRAVLGATIKGYQGIVLTAGNSTATYADNFKTRGYTYRNWTLPDVLPMNGSIVGDVEAKADITVTATGSSASAAPEWACFAWMPTPAAHNLVWNDGFEVDTNGWVATAVAGVTGAATSITRVTTAGLFYEGAAGASVVCPATSDTGASFLIYRRFKRGVTYTVEAYLRSAAAVTVARVKLGISGDIATSSNVALSTTWTRHTTTWTPTADTDIAYFVAGIGAATATTFNLDRVMVYEGTTAPTFSAGGQVPWGVINGASVDVTNKGSFFAIAADANYRAGFDLAGTGSMSTNATAEWYLHPWAITPDDYARGEYQCKVFARVEIASTQADVNIVTSLRPEGGTSYGAERYTQEWGSTGKAITTPGASVFRWVNCGTLVMRVDRNRPARWKLRMVVTNASTSTGAFGIDQIILVPARRSVMSQTGATSADFADFISSTSQTSKIVRWNKRAEISNPASTVSRYPYPDGGLGGANILLPRGDVQMLAWLADYQPDRSDANSSGAGEFVSATVGVSVKPQYVFARA